MPEIEGTFNVGGVALYTKTWMPVDPATANLIFFHGYSDHCNCYPDLFASLSSRGVAVYSLDQRGWGRSVTKPQNRGLTGPTTQVIADMAAFIESVFAQSDTLPTFVMGNSMGGGQILTLACTPQYKELTGKIHGWIAEAPLVSFPRGSEPMKLEVFVGRLAAKIRPNFQLKKPLDTSTLTRIPEMAEKVEKDELCHNTGTLQGLAGMLDRAANLDSGSLTLNDNVTALAIFHGSCDKITSHVASRKFLEAQKLQDRVFKEYEGAYHQLHADLCREEFNNDVGDWILERLESKPHL
ncbi:hypothetical protein Cpir12675_001689 [Ceratocystis pirilliformis]|uniref:Serine aminopeptidase S33 domain-containing protein n=1 Tax=Ceratocystis pirilliformis TaxID=259994 RepID=A0ABR3ZE50_9PEZI